MTHNRRARELCTTHTCHSWMSWEVSRQAQARMGPHGCSYALAGVGHTRRSAADAYFGQHNISEGANKNGADKNTQATDHACSGGCSKVEKAGYWSGQGFG